MTVLYTKLGECKSVGSLTVGEERKEQLLKFIYGYEPENISSAIEWAALQAST